MSENVHECGFTQGAYAGFDYFDAAVDQTLLSQAMDGYESLGWEMDERRKPDTLAGKVTLHLRRNRRILNKVELTRLQRNLEACFAEIVKLEERPKSAATMVSLAVGMAGTAFMAGATFAVVASPPIVWLCVLLAIPGFAGWLAAYPLFKQTVTNVKAHTEPLLDKKHEEMAEVCQKGRALL